MRRAAFATVIGCLIIGCGLSVVGESENNAASSTSSSTSSSGSTSTSSSGSASSSSSGATDEGGADPDDDSGSTDRQDSAIIDDGSTNRQDAPADAPVSPVVPAGNAIRLTKSDVQYVNFAHIPIPPNFTLEAWVRPASFGAEMAVVAEDREPSDPVNQWRLGITPAGAPFFFMSAPDGSSQTLFSPAGYTLQSLPIVLNQWTHLAVTKSGNTFSLYVNGVLVISVATGTPIVRNDDFNFRIGARMGNGGPAALFDGSIDDVRLFNVARTSADVFFDYRTALTASSIPAFNQLIGYWKMDETGGNTVSDAKGAWPGTCPNNCAFIASGAF